MTKVLIVEDEQHLAEGLRFNLEEEGYAVGVVGTGEAALEALLAPAAEFDAVVLDVMLPGIDGFEVVSALRRAERFVPVLMLTARGRPEEVLRGFEAGADDYLAKPFELAILLARLGGLLRRSAWGHRGAPRSADVFSFAGKTINFGELELRARDRTVRLTLMEANLLRYLAANAERVVTRGELLREVWGLSADTDTRAIDNFITRLRRYVEDEPSRPRHLLTVRGLGYRFVPSPGPVE